MDQRGFRQEGDDPVPGRRGCKFIRPVDGGQFKLKASRQTAKIGGAGAEAFGDIIKRRCVGYRSRA